MVLRRRALLRGAMVGGAAYYAGRRMAQGEQREYEQQERLEMLEAQQAVQPQYAAPPPAAPQKSITEQLTELKQLLDAGVLTQPEFEAAKAKVLRG
jgi:membrane protease subunit (stomatin/prohibitin family)